MVRHCYICKLNPKEPGNEEISLHSLPNNMETRNIWFSLLGLGKDAMYPKIIYICSNHFSCDDIIHNKIGKRILKPNALPLPIHIAFEPDETESISSPSKSVLSVSDISEDSPLKKKPRVKLFSDLDVPSSSLSNIELSPPCRISQNSPLSEPSMIRLSSTRTASEDADKIFTSFQSDVLSSTCIASEVINSSSFTLTASETEEISKIEATIQIIQPELISSRKPIKPRVTAIKRRRKTYVGEMEEEDFRSPKTKKKFLLMKKTILSLRTKVRNLQSNLWKSKKRINNLKDLLKYFRQQSFITESSESVLKMVMCWAPGCKHYNVKDTCRFFAFPTDKKLLNKWIKVVRRDVKPGPGARLCSCHFPEGKKENDPSIFSHNIDKRFKFSSPEKRKKSRPVCTIVATKSSEDEVEMPVEIDLEPGPSMSSVPTTSMALLETENYLLKQQVLQLKNEARGGPFSFKGDESSRSKRGKEQNQKGEVQRNISLWSHSLAYKIQKFDNITKKYVMQQIDQFLLNTKRPTVKEMSKEALDSQASEDNPSSSKRMVGDDIGPTSPNETTCKDQLGETSNSYGVKIKAAYEEIYTKEDLMYIPQNQNEEPPNLEFFKKENEIDYEEIYSHEEFMNMPLEMIRNELREPSTAEFDVGEIKSEEMEIHEEFINIPVELRETIPH